MKKTSYLLLTTAIVSGVGTPAFAQSAATPAATTVAAARDDSGLDDIVVTAQRRAETANDVGMAISAFGAEALAQQRINNVRDLTALVPSFTVSQSYQGVPTYTLRGIGFNTINLSATSTVGTYVDEVAYAYPIMNTGPLFDMQRVEVLKGPQGTLYGRNTTAGLIDFITNKPTKEFEAGATAEVGNYETYNLEGFVSGPLAEGIQARVSFKTENSDKGWQISNTRPDERLGKVQRFGTRGALALQPTETTKIDASVNYWMNKSDTVSGQGIGFTPPTDPVTGSSASRNFNTPGLANYLATNMPTKASQADWTPYARRASDIGTGLGIPGPLAENNTFWGLKLRIDQELMPNIKAVSLTSYNEFKRNATFDWSGAPYELLVQNGVGKIKSFAEDLHLEGVSGPVTWLVGGYYAKDKILDSNRTMLGQNANPGLIRFVGSTLLATPFNSGGYTATEMSQAFRTYEDVGNIESSTWSLLANGDWKINEHFTLNAGVRYTEDSQKYNGCSRDFNGNMLPNVNVVNRALYFQAYGIIPPPIVQGGCNTFHQDTGTFGPASSKLDEHNWAWRGALTWTPTPELLGYGSISHGAKSGTTPINAASQAEQNAPVKQELLTAYELGFKTSLGQRTVQLNGAVFYYDYADKQISTYFADRIYTALARLDNIPKSEAYGGEIEATWRPIRTLTFTASGLWLHTEIKDYLGTNAAGQPQDFAGAHFIYSPKFQGSMTATFDQPITQKLGLLATINGRYQTKSNTIFEDLPLYKIPSFDVWNGTIGIHDLNGRWSASLWSRNLFNKYYWTAVASNANVVVRFASPPRTFGLSLTGRF